jgi:molybdate/tungstate transport system substrate-binding protein
MASGKHRGQGRGGDTRRSPAVVLFLALCLGASCKPSPTEIVVFYASSLSAVLGDAAEAFEKANPRLRLRLEPSGSQVAVRKVVELGMRADIVAVADAGLIGKMMIPAHATWSAIFATNEIVLAHKDHSKLTDRITADNWTEILSRPGIRLGRVDPDTSPLGYQTVMVWQLAEAQSPGLVARLGAQCAKEHLTFDEAELLSLLESRAVDYAFLYRSTAEDHHLKILTLPPELNLSRQDLAERYAAASVAVRMQQGQGTGRIAGAPVSYGLAIPANAPHPEAAAGFAAFLFGESGRKLLGRRGFHPLEQSQCAPCAGLPARLAGLVAPIRMKMP